MRVIFLPGGTEPPRVLDIPNELETLQHMVKGYFEVVPMAKLLRDGMILLVNEEGRIKGMEPNRAATFFYSGVTNNYLSKADPRVIVGPALIVGTDGEEFADLTVPQLRRVSFVTRDYLNWSPFEEDEP